MSSLYDAILGTYMMPDKRTPFTPTIPCPEQEYAAEENVTRSTRARRKKKNIRRARRPVTVLEPPDRRFVAMVVASHGLTHHPGCTETGLAFQLGLFRSDYVARERLFDPETNPDADLEDDPYDSDNNALTDDSDDYPLSGDFDEYEDLLTTSTRWPVPADPDHASSSGFARQCDQPSAVVDPCPHTLTPPVRSTACRVRSGVAGDPMRL